MFIQPSEITLSLLTWVLYRRFEPLRVCWPTRRSTVSPIFEPQSFKTLNYSEKVALAQRWQPECLICLSNRFTIIRLDELQIISFNFDFFFLSLSKRRKVKQFGVFFVGLIVRLRGVGTFCRENQFELSQLGQTSLKVGRSTKLPSLWTQLRF